MEIENKQQEFQIKIKGDIYHGLCFENNKLNTFNIFKGEIPLIHFHKPKNINQEDFDYIIDLVKNKLIKEF